MARGFKGGGFNQTRLSLLPLNSSGDSLGFDAEKADTFELGMKTYLLDRTLSLNTTLFYSRFEDYQLGQFDGITLKTFSIDEIDSEGVEIESLWRATDGLTLTGAVVYTNNRYPDDSNIDQVAPTTDGNLRAGAQLSKEWAATAGVTYSAPLTDKLAFIAHLDARYTGDYHSNSSLDDDFKELSLIHI